MSLDTHGAALAGRMNDDLPFADLGGRRLLPGDWLILCSFCLFLFGFYMWWGGPLSLHEARLPETAREMLANHDWIFPKSGGRPWLERPPLPHWIVIATSLLLGQRCDAEWVVRLPSVVMGTLTVLLTAWFAAKAFGRKIGVLSGLVLASTYEFYTYACLAEDDIYLAPMVALILVLFFSMELDPERRSDRRLDVFGGRPWRVVALFVVLGLMTLVKSPMVGTTQALPPIAAYIVWQGDWRALRRYVWLWGWLIVAGLTIPWIAAAVHYYPDVVRNWQYDYKDTKDFDEPVWYYVAIVLPGFCMPWIWGAVIGLLKTWPGAGAQRIQQERRERRERRGFEIVMPSSAVAMTSGGSENGNDAASHRVVNPTPSTVDPSRRASAPNTDRLCSPQATEGGQKAGADRLRRSTGRLLWCWAIIPVLVLSIPHRKHHHYLVPSLAPWAILAAIGLAEVWRRLTLRRPGPSHPIWAMAIAAAATALALAVAWKKIHISHIAVIELAAAIVACVGLFCLAQVHAKGWLAALACMLGVGTVYCWGQVHKPDMVAEDTAFLTRANVETPADRPLYVNSDLLGEMDFFRNLFYLRPSAHLLHNLTFLRDREITAPMVFVVTRASDAAKLEKLGKATIVDESHYTRRERSAADRFALFRLEFAAGLKRYPRPAYINTLQAMDREKGPYCGPPLE